jgi:hypothetical protein
VGFAALAALNQPSSNDCKCRPPSAAGVAKKQIYKTRAIAHADVADYIDAPYNPARRHSHLNGVSPDDFEAAHKGRR